MANLQRIEKLKEFLAADPNDSFTRYALALEYHGLGESQRALDALVELTRIDPRYVPAYHQLGHIAAALNRMDEAREHFRRGIEAASAQGDAHAAKEMQEALEDLH